MNIKELNEFMRDHGFCNTNNEDDLPKKYVCDLVESALKEGRNKAIDEFAEEIAFGIYESVIWDMLATMSKNGSLSDTSDKIVDYVIETSKEIAEQMKGGATDER